jgi:hypothetical protein
MPPNERASRSACQPPSQQVCMPFSLCKHHTCHAKSICDPNKLACFQVRMPLCKHACHAKPVCKPNKHACHAKFLCHQASKCASMPYLRTINKRACMPFQVCAPSSHQACMHAFQVSAPTCTRTCMSCQVYM